MEREFVAERQQGLQNLLLRILDNPMLAMSELVKKFLDPTNYSTNQIGKSTRPVSTMLTAGVYQVWHFPCSQTIVHFFSPTAFFPKIIESALQNVSMFFRSEPHWEVVEPLSNMGTRFRKSHFIIKPKDEPKKRLLLSWVKFIGVFLNMHQVPYTDLFVFVIPRS